MNPKPEIAKTGLSDKLLFEIVEAVRREARPVRIILFGSRARGEWNDRSDIDIAVVPEGGKRFHPSVVEDRIRTLLKIDVLDFRLLNDDFQKEIAENGIVIYEAA